MWNGRWVKNLSVPYSSFAYCAKEGEDFNFILGAPDTISAFTSNDFR